MFDTILLTKKRDRDDPLAAKDRIFETDLYGRTLMVGGGSPAALKAVHHRPPVSE